MLLNLLRYLRGYVRFTVRGRYPERFINIALHNRLRLWSVERRDGEMTACMYMRDYRDIRRYARKSGVCLRVRDRKGLPMLLRRYSDRTGLIFGAAAFVITVFFMSLFIWSIDITGLDTISESEMRSLLRENGVSVGAFRPMIDDTGVSRSIMLSDRRVGWMAVNITGSYVSVEIKEESPSPEVESIVEPCNVKARRDGRIIRIDAEQGRTTLKEGSGVVTGQVVVSGVMDDQLGGVRLVHAKAVVLAETDYHTSFTIPKTVTTYHPTGEVKQRLTADVFGLKLPLTVGSVSTVDVLSDETAASPSPLNVTLPLSLFRRNLYAIEPREVSLDDNSAKELLLKEARLYEVFTLSDCTVTKRDYHFTASDDGYTLSADYTCTEDIAVQEKIGTE